MSSGYGCCMKLSAKTLVQEAVHELQEHARFYGLEVTGLKKAEDNKEREVRALLIGALPDHKTCLCC